jgi:hypothetical protein
MCLRDLYHPPHVVGAAAIAGMLVFFPFFAIRGAHFKDFHWLIAQWTLHTQAPSYSLGKQYQRPLLREIAMKI